MARKACQAADRLHGGFSQKEERAWKTEHSQKIEKEVFIDEKKSIDLSGGRHACVECMRQ